MAQYEDYIRNNGKIELGVKVRDKVTGFEGIVVARVVYSNGCVQYCVKPRVKKGEKMPAGEYIDVEDLEYMDEGVVSDRQDPTGGDMPDKPKFSNRR